MDDGRRVSPGGSPNRIPLGRKQGEKKAQSGSHTQGGALHIRVVRKTGQTMLHVMKETQVKSWDNGDTRLVKEA